MHIYSSRVWKHPKIMLTILKNMNKLDPLVLLYNAPLLLLQDTDIKAFLTMKGSRIKRELGTVYTYPEFRNQGRMNTLLQHFLNSHQKVHLLCDQSIATFYQKYGFEIAQPRGWCAFRIHVFNTFLRPLLGYTLIYMHRSSTVRP